MKHHLTVLATSLVLAAGCASSEDDELSTPPPAAELTTKTQALSPPGYGAVAWEEVPEVGATLTSLSNNLTPLQGSGVALVLHWKAEQLDDAARWAVVTKARSMGIAVHPWLTLPLGTAADQQPGAPLYAKTGYFPNDTNYAEWITKAKQLMSLWRARGLPATTMVVDLEMRRERLERFSQITNDGTPIDQVVTFLRENINRPRHAASITAFRDYVNYAHGLGFKVAATTLLPMVDDYGDDDDDLRQAFNVPLENAPNSASAIAWDEVSFQVQRTLYKQTWGFLTSYFVQDYALLVRLLFGAKAGVGLGITDAAWTDAPVYANGDELRLDVEAARRSGITTAKIGVYSYFGMYTRNTSQWFKAPRTLPPVLPDLQTGLVHASFWTLDGLLNGS